MLNEIVLKNYRNFTDKTLSFTRQMNIIEGKGKTNLLEGIASLVDPSAKLKATDKPFNGKKSDIPDLTGVLDTSILKKSYTTKKGVKPIENNELIIYHGTNREIITSELNEDTGLNPLYGGGFYFLNWFKEDTTFKEYFNEIINQTLLDLTGFGSVKYENGGLSITHPDYGTIPLIDTNKELQFTVHLIGDILSRIAIKTSHLYGKNAALNVQALILIDDFEKHFSYEMSKRLVTVLTTMFPKCQFILTTQNPLYYSPNELINLD